MSSDVPAGSDRDTLVDEGLAASLAGAGRSIGRYTVLDELGSGGMGTVYSAYDPQLDRKVALKLLHAGDSRSDHATRARARLQREAQAIAKVKHPNVIHVYDVGLLVHEGQEQVFVAMELVEGRSLRQWLEQLHATDRWSRGEAVEEIVEVMAQAARGLAAAHEVGLVHRDFKPDNALLGDDGQVRVVDFGLARRVGGSESLDGVVRGETPPSLGLGHGHGHSNSALDERLTRTGARLGTPAYMAPEQFESQDTDGRTDQFALCLVLHEALYGARAFPHSGYALAAAVVRGERQPPPSDRSVPAHLRAVLERGLRIEPDRRFGSMSELVEAMLDDPSLRRGKRNRWLLGIGVVGASVGVAVAGRSPAAEPRDECGYGREHMAAVWNEAQAQQVQAGLRVESLPYAAHVAEGVGRGLEDYAKEWELAHRDACEATHVRNEQTGALLDKRMACLDRRLAALQASIELLARVEPEQVEHALGAVEGLGSIEGCADRTALEATGPPPPDAATAAAVAEIQAQLERAAALSRLRQYTRALEVMETLGPGVEALDYGPLSVELLYARGGARLEAGQLEAGIEDLRASLVRAQALAMDRQVRDSARDLSLALGTRLARPEEALPWADLAEATDERVGSTAASQAELLRARAWVLVEWGLRPEAIEIVGKAYEVGTQAYEPGSHELLSVYSSMGSVYARLGEFESAQGHFEHAVKAAEQYFGPDHPQLLTHYLNLGNVLSAQSKLEAAGRYLQRASDLAERIPGISGHERALVASAMGNLALNEKRFEDAVQHHQHALQLREQTYGLEHPLVGRSLNSLGSAASSLGRIDEAAAYFRRSLAIREQAMGEQHPSLIMVLGNLGVMLAEHHRFAEAVPYLERAHGLVQEHGDDPRREAQQRYWLGRSLAESGADYGRGRTLVEQALERAIAAGKDDTVDDARQWLSTHPERPG